jgi:hypothetical protein
MNKMIILAVLLLAGGVYTFLYSEEDTGGVTNVIEAEKSSTAEEILSAPNNTSDIDSKISTKLTKENINSSQAVKTEKIFPEQTDGSVYIDVNREPELEEEEPESDVIDDNDDDVPDSYSVEDAEVYYVSEEERYPGNLGGPPPSPFGLDPDIDPSEIGAKPPVDSAPAAPVLPGSP